jgi:putative transposase
MARLPRVVMPGHPHLVVHRAQRGQAAFLDDDDRVRYLAALREAARTAGVAIHAYALLPGEVRLLVTPEHEAGLAEMMQSVGRHYVRAFNQRHGCNGTPWEGRFRSTVVEADTKFLHCLKFVETVGHPMWPSHAEARATDAASSVAHHLGARTDPLVSDHPVFWALGNTPFEREAAYRRFMEQPAGDGEVAAILHAALNGWVLGSPAFVKWVGEHTGRRPQRVPRGRPRKSSPVDP